MAEYYNLKYSYPTDFTPANPDKVYKWNMSDQMPLLKNMEYVFGLEDFFWYLNPYPNCIDIINKLKEKYQLVICTIGSLQNIKNKTEYIERVFPNDR